MDWMKLIEGLCKIVESQNRIIKTLSESLAQHEALDEEAKAEIDAMGRRFAEEMGEEDTE